MVPTSPPAASSSLRHSAWPFSAAILVGEALLLLHLLTSPPVVVVHLFAETFHYKNKRVKKSKTNQKPAQPFSSTHAGGIVLDFCVHVRFGLHEQSTNLEVTCTTSSTRPKDRSAEAVVRPTIAPYCVHVSFRLHEQPTNFEETFFTSQMEWSYFTTRTRELKHPK
jgi:hypothetical protein